jgi:hypothetical protein
MHAKAQCQGKFLTFAKYLTNRDGSTENKQKHLTLTIWHISAFSHSERYLTLCINIVLVQGK